MKFQLSQGDNGFTIYCQTINREPITYWLDPERTQPIELSEDGKQWRRKP